MTDDDGQGRLQEFGADLDPAPIDLPDPVCERCGDDLEDSGGDHHRPTPPGVPDFDDLYLVDDADRCLCDDCRDLERYLAARHEHLTKKPWIGGAVAVFCECHDDREVDVQPIGQGDRAADCACSRCGSREVVVEHLPPGAPDHEVEP